MQIGRRTTDRGRVPDVQTGLRPVQRGRSTIDRRQMSGKPGERRGLLCERSSPGVRASSRNARRTIATQIAVTTWVRLFKASRSLLGGRKVDDSDTGGQRRAPARTGRRHDASLVANTRSIERNRYCETLRPRVHPDGRLEFVYLVTRPSPVDVRAFLHRTRSSSGRCPSWTIQLLLPQHFAGAPARFEAAWREALATPLRL
jgi:hypothetical protein